MPTTQQIAACPRCGSVLLGTSAPCPGCGNVQRNRTTDSKSGTVIFLRMLLGLLLLIIVPAIGDVVYLNTTFVRSDAYQQSLRGVLSSTEVLHALGTGIRPSRTALGLLFPLGDSEFAEWSLALTGSRGRGHLYGVANQVNGEWNFSRLSFVSGNGEKIVFTPARPLHLPTVPTKKVYLVPVGLDDTETLQWAPAFYKSKLDIDVSLLPATPVDSKIFESDRDQINANKCVKFLAEKYPEIARDPSAVLIAVTSADMYLPGFVYSNFVENSREEGRYAVVSSARLHPFPLLEKLNPEWLASRLEKILTKNVVLLYFDLPMSTDYTSLLSGGVLSGLEIDRMGGELIGAEGRWHPFIDSGDPGVTIYDGPGNRLLWKMNYAERALPDPSTQLFSVDAGVGLIIQRKADFVFPDDPNLQFTRVYRNEDDRSRSFGIGGTDSFEILLGGQMGTAVDLIMEDGARIHFTHQSPKPGQSGDVYAAGWGGEGRFQNAVANYNGSWQVKTTDGWTYIFPYTPRALPQNVTVLTGFIDPEGGKYEMDRDSFGALISISGPSGNWLHFENDAKHRIRKITSSLGREMQYDYEDHGSLVRAIVSDGQVDSYTYDNKGQMLTAGHGSANPILTNEYFMDGYIKCQTMEDGKKFEYSYFRRERNVIYETSIIDPNGLETYVQYVRGGNLRSLPSPAHKGIQQ
jgi:YD repeat-containing protein